MTLSSVGVWLPIAGQAQREQAAVTVRHALAACAQTAWPFEVTVVERILLVHEAAIHQAAGIPACTADRALSVYRHG